MATLVTQQTSKTSSLGLSAADAVWVATALLHQSNPKKPGFLTADIVAEVIRRKLTDTQERTIYQHVTQHCVANREPKPNRPRMLLALGQGIRRLWIPGDKEDPNRAGAPFRPEAANLPEEFLPLLKWYKTEFMPKMRPNNKVEDPLLALIGHGKHTWADEHADEYVRRLREEW